MELTTESFTKGMVEAVIERGPDYVYNAKKHGGCLYALPLDTPGCLIGMALHKCGVPMHELAKHEGTNAYELLRIYGAGPELGMRANRAQDTQDSGGSWGRALIRFLEPLR